jgi:hypothetical protein
MTLPVEIATIVHEYIRTLKGWGDDDYEIDTNFKQEGSQFYLITVVHKDDLRGSGTVAGGGKSVELRVDATQKKVVRELRFQ